MFVPFAVKRLIVVFCIFFMLVRKTKSN